MTTPQKGINRARGLGYISAGQYNDERALEDWNTVRRKLSQLIMQNVQEDFFNVNISTASVAGQNQYTFYDETNSIDVNKTKQVWIKYESGGEYVEAKPTVKENIENVSYSESVPYYYVSGDSVYIYPAVEDVSDENADGIKLSVSLTPFDLEINDVDTLFPREYWTVISDGMLPLIYQRRGLLNEKQVAQADFEDNVSSMLLDLTERISADRFVQMPSELEYYG